MASGLSTSSTHSRPSDSAPSASSWTMPLPLPSSCGYWIETTPEDREHDQRREQPPPAARAQRGGALDEPHPADRDHADDRPGHERPRHLRRVQRVVGQRVRGIGAQRDPADRGRDHRGGQRGQHERQGDRAEQHLQREQRAAERHVVDRGEAGARAGGDEQPPLPDRQPRPVRQPAGGRRAGQLRGGLAAERDAEADGDDRQHRPREAGMKASCPPLQPQRLGHLRTRPRSVTGRARTSRPRR